MDIPSWQYYKQLSNTEDLFELAKSTFYLNRTNVSGVLKGGVIGGLSQTGKYKMNARFNKLEFISRIKRIAAMHDRIVLSQQDGIQFVNSLNRRKMDVFVNLDPPYYENGKNLYLNFYADKDHQELAKCVPNLKKPWMVSYDNVPFVLNLYRAYPIIKYRLSSGTSNGIGEEVIILSNQMQYKESITKLNIL